MVFRILVVAIVGFLLFASTRPDTFHVERSATIAAPPEAVFTHVASFEEWKKWSPWEKLDPNMKREMGGTDGTVGAMYSWTGNDKVGAGRMTVTELTPHSRIGIKLEFLKPFESTATTQFALAPEGTGTKITWSMEGKNNFMSKVMCLFMDMDKMVGADYERGLASLKSLSETPAGS